jgi:cytosine/adenosine deaminase-related metal-dependent hydrolase
MLLLRDADFIITMDPARRVVTRGSVVVVDGAIAAIDKREVIERDHADRLKGAEVIDATGTAITPGFINTHAHTMEHLSRGLIPDSLPTRPWAQQYFFPFQAALTEQETYLSAKLACLDMLKCGTTCFIDSSILNANAHVDSVVQAVDELGGRAVLGRGVCDRLPPDLPEYFRPEWRRALFSPSAGDALAQAEALLARWTVRSSGRIRAWATIFGLFSFCSDELFAGVKRLADRFGVGTNFHMASSIEEAQALEERAGVWPITQLERLGALGPNVLLTHVVAIRDEELDLLATRDVKVAHCPGAALRLAKGASRLGKFPEMLRRGVTVSLGADGVCSSGTFDPMRLMFVAAGLFKDARMDATMIPAETALEMATLNGAKSLLWDDQIGSIETGKRADLVIFDLQRPEWVPTHDVVRNLVYSADGGSVKTVLVDGRVVLRDRTPLVDERRLLDDAREAGERIARRTGLDPRPRWPRV